MEIKKLDDDRSCLKENQFWYMIKGSLTLNISKVDPSIQMEEHKTLFLNWWSSKQVLHGQFDKNCCWCSFQNINTRSNIVPWKSRLNNNERDARANKAKCTRASPCIAAWLQIYSQPFCSNHKFHYQLHYGCGISISCWPEVEMTSETSGLGGAYLDEASPLLYTRLFIDLHRSLNEPHSRYQLTLRMRYIDILLTGSRNDVGNQWARWGLPRWC